MEELELSTGLARLYILSVSSAMSIFTTVVPLVGFLVFGLTKASTVALIFSLGLTFLYLGYRQIIHVLERNRRKSKVERH